MNQDILRNQIIDASYELFAANLPAVLEQYSEELIAAGDADCVNNIDNYLSMHELAFEESCGFWVNGIRSHEIMKHPALLIPFLPKDELNTEHKAMSHIHNSLEDHLRHVVSDTFTDVLGCQVAYEIVYNIAKMIKSNDDKIEGAEKYTHLIRRALEQNIKVLAND